MSAKHPCPHHGVCMDWRRPFYRNNQLKLKTCETNKESRCDWSLYLSEHHIQPKR